MHLSEAGLRGPSAWLHQQEIWSEEEVLGIFVVVNSPHVSEEAKKALSMLRKSMYPGWSLVYADIHGPIDEHVFEHRVTLVQCVDLALADILYNIR